METYYDICTGRIINQENIEVAWALICLSGQIKTPTSIAVGTHVMIRLPSNLQPKTKIIIDLTMDNNCHSNNSNSSKNEPVSKSHLIQIKPKRTSFKNKTGQKRIRRMSPYVVNILEKFYKQKKYPSRENKDFLADMLGYTRKNISHWFQNRRAREVRAKREEQAKREFTMY